MSADGENDICRLIVQVFAEYLRDWEMRRKVPQYDRSVGVSGTILDSVDLPLGGGEGIHDVLPREDILVDKSLNEGGQKGGTCDSHSGG
jgi:hypothetical protein